MPLNGRPAASLSLEARKEARGEASYVPDRGYATYVVKITAEDGSVTRVAKRYSDLRDEPGVTELPHPLRLHLLF